VNGSLTMTLFFPRNWSNTTLFGRPEKKSAFR